MATIGFLACETTLPGAELRRGDAFEHDLEVNALAPAIEALGHTFTVIDWRAPMSSFQSVDLLLLGTAWNYQDHEDEFLAKLDALENSGIVLCNPASVVRWNLQKTYLKDLAERGVPTIPTQWIERPVAADITAAFDTLRTEKVVVKRQIGAGAEGQSLFTKSAPPPQDWSMNRPAMIQPFLPSIQQEGEFSFIFVDGNFSHALIKKAAKGDYRIQSLYGGTETAIDPPDHDRQCAATVLDALPFEIPLYARIDMVRGDNDALLLMEAELIEPYLYPVQGPELGRLVAKAADTRVHRS